MLERLILGLIWANPDENPIESKRKKDHERLAEIMTIIVGYSRGHRANADDDEKALISMAMEHIKDLENTESDPACRVRGDRKLAREITKGYPEHLKEAANERLRRKFKKRKNELIERATNRFLTANTAQQFALDEIERLLGKFGVKFYAYD
jgi:hypothetical protein